MRDVDGLHMALHALRFNPKSVKATERKECKDSPHTLRRFDFLSEALSLAALPLHAACLASGFRGLGFGVWGSGFRVPPVPGLGGRAFSFLREVI